MNLRNWKILHKILLAIFALALAALAGGGYAGYKMKSIDDTYSRLIDTDYQTPAQSPSASPHPASDPKTPPSLPL